MSFPWSTAQAAAIARLSSSYNGTDYVPGSNPFGFGNGGHVVNFIPAIQDVASAAQAAGDAATAAGNSATAAATSETNAATSGARLVGTSATSFTPGVGFKSFVTQASKLFTVGGFVTIVSAADPTGKWMAGQVTAYSGTALTVNVTSFNGAVAAADWTILVSAAPGAQGLPGLTGPTGASASVQWAFSNATADADPGNGTVRLNNATVSSATQIFFDNLDRNSADVTTFLDALDDSTNTALRGFLYLTQISDPTRFAIFAVTGAVTNATGYRKVAVTHVASSAAFTNGEPVGAIFTRTGDKGTDGTGAGTVINDTASQDGRIPSFVGTSGAHIQDSGYVIGTSGHSLATLDGANTWSAAQTVNAGCTLGQALFLTGDITPGQITANQNDFNPASLSSAAVLRLSSDASRNITGLQGGSDGRLMTLLNVGSQNIVLKSQDSNSSAANRFQFAGDVTLLPNQGVALIYDTTSSVWRLAAGRPVAPTTSGILDLIGSTQGQILYRDASGWAVLAPGTSGQVLQTQGAGANPAWTVGGVIIDRAYATYTANANLTSIIPADNTTPQSTEGTQVLSASITPKSTTNRIRARVMLWGSPSIDQYINAALFTGGTSAVQAASVFAYQGVPSPLPFEYEYVPGTTSTQTITVRVGPHSASTVRLNGDPTTSFFGAGLSACTLVLEEIKA